VRSPVTGADLTPLGIREEAAAALARAGWEIPHDDMATFRVARDYLLDLGYDCSDAEGAANMVRLAHPTSAPYLLSEAGHCRVCGRGDSDWHEGAGDYLCPDHQDSY
jgi:hypothetical protein